MNDAEKKPGAPDSPCPSEYQLDDYEIAGRPSDHPVARHAADCARCRQRLAEASRVREEFQRQVYPSTVDAVVKQLAGEESPRERTGWLSAWLQPWRLATSAALLVVVVLGLVLWMAGQTPPGSPTTIGMKGSIAVQVFCQHGQQVILVHEGDTLLPGDRLRFLPALPGSGFVMVVSVETGGGVHLFYPREGSAALPVSGREEALPGSIILDNSPGEERIFVLFGKSSFDFGSVRKAIEKAWSASAGLGRLTSLPLDLDQATVLFRKGSVAP